MAGLRIHILDVIECRVLLVILDSFVAVRHLDDVGRGPLDRVLGLREFLPLSQSIPLRKLKGFARTVLAVFLSDATERPGLRLTHRLQFGHAVPLTEVRALLIIEGPVAGTFRAAVAAEGVVGAADELRNFELEVLGPLRLALGMTAVLPERQGHSARVRTEVCETHL